MYRYCLLHSLVVFFQRCKCSYQPEVIRENKYTKRKKYSLNLWILQLKILSLSHQSYGIMHIEFDKEYLRELFEQGRTSDKKHRYQPEVIRGYYKCVMFLKRAKNVEQLYQIHSLNYEVLQGDKVGVSSVRINRKYRLEFVVNETMGEQIVTICRLLDISNHYK